MLKAENKKKDQLKVFLFVNWDGNISKLHKIIIILVNK